VNARDCSTAELLRVIGEERERHHPQDVSEAERELIARLGGPFTLTGWAARAEVLLRWLIGSYMVALALTIVLAGTAVAASPLAAGADQPALAGLIILGVAAALAGVVLRVGIELVARWNPHDWLGRGALKLVRGRVSLSWQDPWRAYWLRVIGAERHSRSEGEAAEALQQVYEMHRKRLRATRRNVRFVASLGAWPGLLGTCAAVLYLWDPGRFGLDLQPFYFNSLPRWLGRVCDVLAEASLVVASLSFPCLLAGCCGLVFCCNWARKALACVFATWVGLSVFFLELSLYVAADDASLLALALCAAFATLCPVLSWDLFRSVLSPSVREVCGACAEEPDTGPPDSPTTRD
jgi:hypothetical protein